MFIWNVNMKILIYSQNEGNVLQTLLKKEVYYFLMVEIYLR